MDDSPAEVLVHVAELSPPSGLLALTAPVLAIASAEGIVESPRSDLGFGGLNIATPAILAAALEVVATSQPPPAHGTLTLHKTTIHQHAAQPELFAYVLHQSQTVEGQFRGLIAELQTKFQEVDKLGADLLQT